MRKINDNVSMRVLLSGNPALSSNGLSHLLSERDWTDGGMREQKESGTEPSREQKEKKNGAISQVQFEPNDCSMREHFLKTNVESGNRERIIQEREENSRIGERIEKRSLSLSPDFHAPKHAVKWCPQTKNGFIVVGREGATALRIKRLGKEHTATQIVSDTVWENQFIEGITL